MRACATDVLAEVFTLLILELVRAHDLAKSCLMSRAFMLHIICIASCVSAKMNLLNILAREIIIEWSVKEN